MTTYVITKRTSFNPWSSHIYFDVEKNNGELLCILKFPKDIDGMINRDAWVMNKNNDKVLAKMTFNNNSHFLQINGKTVEVYEDIGAGPEFKKSVFMYALKYAFTHKQEYGFRNKQWLDCGHSLVTRDGRVIGQYTREDGGMFSAAKIQFSLEDERNLPLMLFFICCQQHGGPGFFHSY